MAKTKIPEDKILKGVKIKLYPNKTQEEMFYKFAKASDFVWNYMLTINKGLYNIKHPEKTGRLLFL